MERGEGGGGAQHTVGLHGHLADKEPPPQDLAVGLHLWPYGGSRGARYPCRDRVTISRPSCCLELHGGHVVNSGDKPHVGIAGVTLHKSRPLETKCPLLAPLEKGTAPDHAHTAFAQQDTNAQHGQSCELFLRP